MVIIKLYEKKNSDFNWNLLLLWILSLLILAFSFYHQYVENMKPCKLCNLQRYIYIAIVVIAPFGKLQRFNPIIRMIINIIFVFGLLLAIYHALIQFGLIADSCLLSQKIENINDFMNLFEEKKNSCASSNWKLFGLPASVYNAVFFVGSLIFLNLGYLNRNR